MLTQWYDIGGVIGAIFIGLTAMLALVFYLEQWLARPVPRCLAAPADRELDEPDDNGLEPPGAAPIR
jgi:hypothetical protein